jgi:hypothetical protein
VTTPLVFDDQNGELRNNWRWFRDKKAPVLRIEWAVHDGDEIAPGAKIGVVRWNNGDLPTDLVAPRNCCGTVSAVADNDDAQWARLGRAPSQVMIFIKPGAPASAGQRSVRFDPTPPISSKKSPDGAAPISPKRRKPQHQ